MCGDAVPREVVCPRPCPAHQAWPLLAPAAEKHINKQAHKQAVKHKHWQHP